MPKEYDSWARAPRVRDWAVVFGGDEEAHYRGRRFAFSALGDPHTSCMTCGPEPPCQRLGPLFSAEMKRRATVGDGSLFGHAWWFAFPAPGVQRSIRMTCGSGPSCHRLGRLGFRCASAEISRCVSGASGRLCLEEGFTPRAAVTLSHFLPILRPFTSTLSCFVPP
jgi:hypothetical protein